ncbi:hypothetical protein CYMTET_45544 [Cymbomonas tetramitiformis]|uniref:Uncharacterized protein n=1 Tax=Cymbomonas tetramitiformis TaxID=36881 RepID=A0AAE0BZD7_9CHLO|nr:hypothetical protein CYMTET_45544 [Cymbomonas tetramitiformis]
MKSLCIASGVSNVPPSSGSFSGETASSRLPSWGFVERRAAVVLQGALKWAARCVAAVAALLVPGFVLALYHGGPPVLPRLVLTALNTLAILGLAVSLGTTVCAAITSAVCKARTWWRENSASPQDLRGEPTGEFSEAQKEAILTAAVQTQGQGLLLSTAEPFIESSGSDLYPAL